VEEEGHGPSLNLSSRVCGTIKLGFLNHRLLEGCEFCGHTATVPTYKMNETGFPVIMPDPEGKPISGELRTQGNTVTVAELRVQLRPARAAALEIWVTQL
jgi:gamma-glutamyl AIG2-like cyclotransferase